MPGWKDILNKGKGKAEGEGAGAAGEVTPPHGRSQKSPPTGNDVVTGLRLVRDDLLDRSLLPSEGHTREDVREVIFAMADLVVAEAGIGDKARLAERMQELTHRLDVLLGQPGKGTLLAQQMRQEYHALAHQHG